MRNDGITSRADKQSKAVVATTFNKIAADRWERIFGTPEQIKKRRQAAIKKQTHGAKACESGKAVPVPAIHGDKLYYGYDPALRMHLRGRTHRREVMRERGLRCVFD